MYQTGNVDILTLKQLLGHSSVGTTQIYTHLQEFQVRSAIEENPLGKVLPIKVAKASLDTTDAAGRHLLKMTRRERTLLSRPALWRPLRALHRMASGQISRQCPTMK